MKTFDNEKSFYISYGFSLQFNDLGEFVLSPQKSFKSWQI